jgi:hypothetical protein
LNIRTITTKGNKSSYNTIQYKDSVASYNLPVAMLCYEYDDGYSTWNPKYNFTCAGELEAWRGGGSYPNRCGDPYGIPCNEYENPEELPEDCSHAYFHPQYYDEYLGGGDPTTHCSSSYDGDGQLHGALVIRFLEEGT